MSWSTTSRLSIGTKHVGVELQVGALWFGDVDFKTSVVKSVRMEKSTGRRILDQAALNAFRQWRFKPGTVRRFRTPINYGMVGNRGEAMERIRRVRANEER